MTEKEAILLLSKYAKDKRDFDAILKHSKAVQKVALRIAKKIKGIDIEFIRTASLLHDIGRFECPPGKFSFKHGIIGAEILRKEGLKKHALAAERHLGAGISKKDIIEQKLDLPLKDYLPKTREEKIIAHADNLIENNREITIEKTIERFRKELGEKVAKKIKKLNNEVNKMVKVDFEEKIIKCASCGKKIKVIIRKGYSTEGLLCQKCGLGIDKLDEYKD